MNITDGKIEDDSVSVSKKRQKFKRIIKRGFLDSHVPK